MYSNRRHDELEPRPVPIPSQFQEISAKPEVPELSVVFDSSENNSKPPNKSPLFTTNHTTRETYSEWKNRQNRSPICNETRYEPRDKNYYGTLSYDYDHNPYSRISDNVSHKIINDYHKCACQNTPTVRDIYNMMQLQNDQMKFLLETIQKLLVSVLSNQQNQHKCCCFEHGYCKKDDNLKNTEFLKKNNTQEESELQNSVDDHLEKSQINLKKNEENLKMSESNNSAKPVIKPNITTTNEEQPKSTEVIKCSNKKINIKEKETTYSVVSDESLDLNANDVQVTEAPISPEQSIHIEMQSSSEDSSNSEYENENKKIEVGWTMYKNIIGQVNNLLDDKNDLKSEIHKPVELIKSSPINKLKNFESHKQFLLPENNKIDSSLQMQALAMQYLSPEQAIKFDMNKHIVPTTQHVTKSPNNYSISTLHYMERYHLIGSEKDYISENPQQKLTSEALLNKQKKTSRKTKKPPKILNITELKQQPKLS